MIEVWYQVYKIQEPHTLKTLLENLQFILSLSQGYTYYTSIYLGKIRNLTLCCKSGGRGFYTSLFNLILVQHLDPRRYQKVLYSYEVGSIN